jgi:hypothetical protein
MKKIKMKSLLMMISYNSLSGIQMIPKNEVREQLYQQHDQTSHISKLKKSISKLKKQIALNEGTQEDRNNLISNYNQIVNMYIEYFGYKKETSPISQKFQESILKLTKKIINKNNR